MDTDPITTEAAAKELGVSARRIRALIKAGRLKAKAVGVAPRITYLIRREDLDAVRDRKPGRPVATEGKASTKPRRRSSGRS